MTDFLRTGINYTVESMKSAVEKVRGNAPGTELGDITLANGKLLRGAKIRKLEPTGLTLIHADGIGLIPIELLPVEIMEKFDLGPGALLPRMEQAQAVFLDKTITETVEDTSSKQISALKKRIATLEIQIESSTKHKDKLESEVRGIEEQIKAAESQRAPTQTLRSMKDVAEGNAGMARNEIKVQKHELEQRRAELDMLQKQR